MRPGWWLSPLTVLLALGCAAEDQPALQRRPMEVLTNRETLPESEAAHALTFAFQEFVVPDDERGRAARFLVTNQTDRIVVGAVIFIETYDAQGNLLGTCPWTVSTTSGWLDRGAQQEALLGFELEAEAARAQASVFEVTVADPRETSP